MRLAQMRKFGQCVCNLTGVLSAGIATNEQGGRFILATLCDQHKNVPDIARASLEAMAQTGYDVRYQQGKAREPVEDDR